MKVWFFLVRSFKCPTAVRYCDEPSKKSEDSPASFSQKHIYAFSAKRDSFSPDFWRPSGGTSSRCRGSPPTKSFENFGPLGVYYRSKCQVLTERTFTIVGSITMQLVSSLTTLDSVGLLLLYFLCSGDTFLAKWVFYFYIIKKSTTLELY